MRRELCLSDPCDILSPAFLRFVIRFSERLDIDIPSEHYALLTTVGGCVDYLGRLEAAQRAAVARPV
ncbi:MAG: hypothetical protein Q8L48_27620 [Archangium sp.]|nr:hypothetical protein [Archangium sp.]